MNNGKSFESSSVARPVQLEKSLGTHMWEILHTALAIRARVHGTQSTTDISVAKDSASIIRRKCENVLTIGNVPEAFRQLIWEISSEVDRILGSREELIAVDIRTVVDHSIHQMDPESVYRIWNDLSNAPFDDTNSCDIKFSGNNPAFEVYSAMTPDERGKCFEKMEHSNKSWSQQIAEKLGKFAFYVVINGRVVDYSMFSGERPDDKMIYDYGQRFGIVPFVFPSGPDVGEE